MSCFQVAVLASGSKGNATVMRCESGMVLVDAGISCRRIMQGMQKLGLRPENLDAVFITHEHIDHVKGLETFAKKYPVPIYASRGTWQGIRQTLPRLDLKLCNRQILAPQTEVTLGGLQVRSFSVSHDALEPAGYLFRSKGHVFGYVTDTGYVSDVVKRELEGAEVLVIESNHDPILLKNGRYPPPLQKRIKRTLSAAASETYIGDTGASGQRNGRPPAGNIADAARAGFSGPSQSGKQYAGPGAEHGTRHRYAATPESKHSVLCHFTGRSGEK